MSCTEEDVLPCASCTPAIVPANEMHWVSTPCGEGSASSSGGGGGDTDLTELTARVGASEAAITTEATVRATADSAMAALITTLTASTAANSAAITNEQTVRASQDAAIASTLTSVSATTNLKNRTFIASSPPVALSTGDLWIDTGNGNKLKRWDGAAWVDTTVASGAIAAAVATETTARTTADDALAALITSLTAVVGTNTAAISTEASARASADSALATTIASIVAAAGTTSTVFVQASPPTANSVNDVWFDSDDGYKPYYWSGTSWTDATDTRLTGAIAAITTEQTARATADTALASSITSLTSTVNGNVSNISTIMSTYATQSYADTKKSEAIAAANAYGDALISTEQAARVAADNALSTSISTTAASFGAKNQTFISGSAPTAVAIGDLWIDTGNGNALKRWNGSTWVDTSVASGAMTAAVSAESSARATADGYLSGKYTLTVAAGNVITGMNITSSSGSGTPVSDVTFQASNFKIATTGASVVPFSVSGTTVTLQNVVITGTLSGVTGTFSGSLSGATGTFTGSLSGATGSFSGSLTSPVVNGGALKFTSDSTISMSTSDGSDNGNLRINGGGSNGSNRGGQIDFLGNEYNTAGPWSAFGGSLILSAGLVSTGSIRLRDRNGDERLVVTSDPAVDVKGCNLRIFDGYGTQTLRVDNANGDVYIQGTRVLRARYGSTPATLGDVIALLQYMGFCP